MDNEELWTFCGCRKGSNTFFPCPQCMVPRDKLCELTTRFEARETSPMRALVAEAAMARSFAEKERTLQKASVHDVQVSPPPSPVWTSNLIVRSYASGIFAFRILIAPHPATSCTISTLACGESTCGPCSLPLFESAISRVNWLNCKALHHVY